MKAKAVDRRSKRDHSILPKSVIHCDFRLAFNRKSAPTGTPAETIFLRRFQLVAEDVERGPALDGDQQS